MDSQDLYRMEIYKYLIERAEHTLNSETTARDTYVTIKGVDGTQNVGDVKNGYTVYSYLWGVTNTGIKNGSLAGGGPAFRDLYVVINYEKGLASAFQYMTQGKSIDEVDLFFLDQQSKTIGDIKLEKDGNAGVLISDIQVIKAKSKENRPIAIVAFSYAKITHKVSGASGNYALTSGKGG
jgi:hypothetical protein